MDYSIQRAKVYCKLSLHRDQSRIWSGYGGVEDFFEGLARRKIFHDTSISTLRLSSSLLRVCRASRGSNPSNRATQRGFPLSMASPDLEPTTVASFLLPQTRPRFELQLDRVYRHIALLRQHNFPLAGSLSTIPTKIFIPGLADSTKED
jgi:hypothetical protein